MTPNDTPLATVDGASGSIVSADLVVMTDEDKRHARALHDVQESFGLEQRPPEVQADGMMATGENLEALAKNDVTLFSPVSPGNPTANPAQRDDPSQSVPQTD